MIQKTLFAALLASSALSLAATSPAAAGQDERARQAIAAAEAKLHTADSIGTGAETPRITAEARAALSMARENLAAGHEKASIAAAIRAQALADTAIGELQQSKNDAVADAQASERATAQAAQNQTAAAQQQADVAQHDAAAANARADAAQQAAASSAADAAAARNAAAMAASQPTQVETTVTTQQPRTARRSTTKTVTKRAPTRAPAAVSSSGSVTTTTKVTTP